MKRFLCCFFVAVALCLGGCKQDEVDEEALAEVLNDGTYEGTGEGRSGIILVRSVVQNHVITSIRAVSHSESAFTRTAIDSIIGLALARQDYLDVQTDAVSGATLTSRGLITAINSSIDAAKGKQAQQLATYTDSECDIVVVGAGGAGLSAAIAAADLGAKVVVLEKQGIVGGNTNYSTGGINAAGTAYQAALGISDSRQLFFDDTYSGGHQLGEPDLIWSLVNHAPETVEWLVGLGADLRDVGMLAGSSVKRAHRPKGGSAIGAHLIKILSNAAAARQIEVRTNSTVRGLISNGDSVTGVIVSSGSGNYRIAAKAVVIATGGFGANLDMVRRYAPQLAGFKTLNHKGATGDAFGWVTALGGSLVQMEQIQIHPTAEAGSCLLITEAVRGNGAILVNQQGARFVNEMSTRDSVSAAILQQQGAVAYLLFDQQVRASLASIETYYSQGLLAEGATPGLLAEQLGVDTAALASAVAQYNDMQRGGLDTQYGRAAAEMPVALTEAPFYAVRVAPAIHHTMGGIGVDSCLHVLKANGEVIPSLYAAGEVTGGLHGANRLGGNGVADAIVNGRLAGITAAQSVMKKK